MKQRSRTVTSNQSGPHPRLEEVVRRHLAHRWRQPVAEHTKAAFRLVEPALDGRPLVLDSGCGTGESSERLAHRHPTCQVIGIDRSAHRLARQRTIDRPEGVVCVRADLVDFWRLALEAGWRLAHHYLLYPNPWPKAVHLQRRWHAHPVLPVLLALGGRLELRSNWALYVEEFRQALSICGADEVFLGRVEDDEPLTPFERKYRSSGHELWVLRVDLDSMPPPRP